MKKAVIYTRTAVPNPASNKKQEELCSQYARNNGYAVVSIYTDNGFLGTNAHRPSFRKLMDSRKSKGWDVIIVSDCSRFFRKPRSFVRYMKVLRRAGKDLISVRDGEFSYADTGITSKGSFRIEHDTQRETPDGYRFNSQIYELRGNPVRRVSCCPTPDFVP